MLTALPAVRRCKAPVYTVAISRDGSKYLWAGGTPGGDCTICVSSVTPDKVLHTLEAHMKPAVRARFLDDGSVVSFSFDSHLCRWTSAGDLAVSNETRPANRTDGFVRTDGFAISNDGQLAVTGDGHGEINGWLLKDGSRSFTIMENSKKLSIEALALERSGKRLVSGGTEGKIRVWSIATQRQESEIDLGWGHHIQGLAWHPEGSIFAAAIAPDGSASEGSQSRVMLLDSSTGKEVESLFPDGHQLLCCTFSPDGRLLAAAGGGNDYGDDESEENCIIHVWDFASGQEIAALSGHTGLVRDLAFMPDGHWLLSVGWDNTVRSWCLTAPK